MHNGSRQQSIYVRDWEVWENAKIIARFQDLSLARYLEHALRNHNESNLKEILKTRTREEFDKFKQEAVAESK